MSVDPKGRPVTHGIVLNVHDEIRHERDSGRLRTTTVTVEVVSLHGDEALTLVPGESVIVTRKY